MYLKLCLLLLILVTLCCKSNPNMGAELYPTPHFVPEGISSSLRDFIVLVLNIEVFQIKFFLKIKSFKKKKKKKKKNMLTVRAETLEGVAVVPLFDVEALGPVEARIGVARVLLVAVGSFVLGAAGALVVFLNKGAKTKTQVSTIRVIFYFYFLFFFFFIRSQCLR